MDNGRTGTGGWTRRALLALAAAVVAAWMAGCGPAGGKEVRKGRAAEALGNYAEAKQRYAQAAAVDNADGARFLAELLLAQDAAELFGTPAEKDADWVAKAEALDAQIARLERQAEANGTPVEGVRETLAGHEKAIQEAKENLERIAAERRVAEEAARLKAEAEARAAAEEARRVAAEKAAERAKEEAAANAIRNLFAKAKKAEEAGLINFYGFYLGMPKDDAVALREYYGLDEEECKIEVVSCGTEVSSLTLSLLGLRGVTKGGNSFEELAQTVANRVGDLKWNDDGYEYSTIDGIKVRISNKNGNGSFYMHGGKHVEKLAVKNLAAMLGTGKKAGETKTIALLGGAMMEMVWCPPGAFMMGSPEGEEGRDDDEMQHKVTLTKGFWMAKTEVTQKQWKSVMGNNPSKHKGDEFPVENLSWNDCQEFCKKMGLTLPTEAEWEYACRAGSTGPYAGNGRLEDMGWSWENSDRETHPVGQKRANAWGLYDMHGNVDEWCEDWEGEYLKGAATDPKGPASGSSRVIRGGSCWGIPSYCRSANRAGNSPAYGAADDGFRPVARQD